MNREKSTPLRIAILGGGIAGVTAAMRLAKERNVSVDLYEKEMRLGGLQRSFLINNNIYDIGAFIFSDSYNFFDTFPTTKELFLRVNCDIKKITPQNHISNFTFTIKEFLREYGISLTLFAIFRLIVSNNIKKEARNSRDQLILKLGITFYEFFGLKNYIENLFKTEDRNIGIEFVNQRMGFINSFSLLGTIKSKILRKTTKKNKDISIALGRPAKGFDAVFKEVYKQLISFNVKVLLGETVKSIDIENKSYLLKTSKESIVYNHIISTIPPPCIFQLLNRTPLAKYSYMNLISLFYKGKLNFTGSILMNYSKNGKWKRIVSFPELYNNIGTESYFTVEITIKDNSSISTNELRTDFEQHMKKTEFISDLEFCGSKMSSNAYPVFIESQSYKIQKDLQLLKRLGIISTGRQGLFEHSSSFKSIQVSSNSIKGLLSTIDN